MLPAKRILIADAMSVSAGRTADILKEAGYETIIAADGRRALEMCEACSPYAVVADAVLPSADGYSLARLIRNSSVEFIPGVVVTHLPGMCRRLNFPGTCTLEKPYDAEKLIAAIEKVKPETRVPTEAMLTRIGEYLDKIGIPEHPGRKYIAMAVFMMHEDMTFKERLTAGLYPLVAEAHGVDAKATERAMRHAIDKAWSNGSIDAQYEIFKNTIDAARGKPTCGGMIAQLAHMLRREVF